jgi:hypothetical protein
MEVIGIIQTDFATADAQRQAYQDRIELEGEGANLVGVTINLQRNVAGVIPVSRAVEFNAALVWLFKEHSRIKIRKIIS